MVFELSHGEAPEALVQGVQVESFWIREVHLLFLLETASTEKGEALTPARLSTRLDVV